MGVLVIHLVKLTLRRLEGAKGRPRTQTWAEAVGFFLQSGRQHSRYPDWKVLRGAPTLKIVGGCCRGVFAICLVTLTLPQLGGAKGFLALDVRGGCCRGVFALWVVAATVHPIGRC